MPWSADDSEFESREARKFGRENGPLWVSDPFLSSPPDADSTQRIVQLSMASATNRERIINQKEKNRESHTDYITCLFRPGPWVEVIRTGWWRLRQLAVVVVV